MAFFSVDQDRGNKLKSCYSGLSTNFNDVFLKSLWVCWGNQQMVVSCESDCERYIRAKNVINKMTTLETDISFQFSSSLCVIKTVLMFKYYSRF